MKILISHVYSNDNKGDAALLSVLISDIKRGFDNPDMTILTLDTLAPGETFDGVTMKHAFMYYAREQYKNRVLQAIYAAYITTLTFITAFSYRWFKVNIPLPKSIQEVVKLYEDADIVISVGGGYVRGKEGLMGTFGLFFILHPFVFSYILGKKTVGYTQSVGPFGNRFQERMARFAVKRLNGIIVREHISLELLKKWGIKKNVSLSVDSGFAFQSNTSVNLHEKFHIPEEKMIVGVTVRAWLNSKAQEHYERSVAALADHIVTAYNAAVIFIPQVTVELQSDDDRESSKRVYSYMEEKDKAYVVKERYDHHIVKAMYADLDYLVGTRFHSVIFALTSKVPSMAIEYEHKTRGIMADLGLEQWVVNIKKVESDNLIDMFDRLTRERSVYLRHLDTVLPGYIEEANKAIYTVKDIYEN
ncbi:MAG TPA: polysaccharide pyruvyl transferase family protein [Candidatus Paceibacterota bacterium]|nr:polysaccharide pyruvyl transferase family protein [Candidatus Paceibacterota bacterium]